LFGRDDPNWRADLARVGTRFAFLKEQSLWAIWVYRYGRRVDQRGSRLRRKIETKFYWMLFRMVETVTGISIPKACSIGPGLRIWHFGGIFLHPNTVIGRNCTLRQGVTIGNKGNDDGAPVLGDDVELGAYAQIIGPIRVGDRCQVGALTAVVKDLPADKIAVGPATRILERNRSDTVALKD
jgi:serine O-acetyltransferase